MPFLHLSFSGPLMRCRYSFVFPISGQMTALSLPGCDIRFPFTWSMTSQSSPSGLARGSGLLGLEGGVLIVVTWFVMRPCPYKRLSFVLYMYCVGIFWVYAAFWCAAGCIGLMSYGMMCGTHWVGRLGTCPGWNFMPSCGSTLVGGKWGRVWCFLLGMHPLRWCHLWGGVPWWIFLWVAGVLLFTCPLHYTRRCSSVSVMM